MPNTASINNHFIKCGDADIHIRDEGIIAKHQLLSCSPSNIACESNDTSTAAELKALLQNSVVSKRKNADHIAESLNEVHIMTNVGMQCPDLALLPLELVYSLFVNQAVMRVFLFG